MGLLAWQIITVEYVGYVMVVTGAFNYRLYQMERADRSFRVVG